MEFKEDNKQSVQIVSIIAFLLALSSMFILVQNPESQNTGILTYVFMISVITLAVALIEFYVGGIQIPDAVFFGTSKEMIYVGAIAGTIIAFFLGSASTALILPITASLTAFQNIGTFMAIDVAPVVESLFFRGILFPTFASLILLFIEPTKRNKAIALALGMLTAGYIFGVFHFNVWLNQTGFQYVLTHDYITVGVILACIWSFGLLVVGISFELFAHKVNNIMSLLSTGAITPEYAIVDFMITAVVFFAIVEFVYSRKRS